MNTFYKSVSYCLGIFLIASILVLASCERFAKVRPDDSGSNPSTGISETRITEGDIAIALAKVLLKPEARAFLKKQALLQFDGDYDLLYSQVKSKMVGNYTFEQLILQNGISKSNLDLYINDNPLFNISIPVNIDTWDEVNYIPSVAILPNAKEDSYTQVKTYNSSGELTMVDAKADLADPYVVMGKSERIRLENGKLVAYYYNSLDSLYLGCKDCVPYSQTSNQSYTNSLTSGSGTNTDIIGEDGDVPPTMIGGPTGTVSSCDRDKRKAKEEMGEIQFKSLSELNNAEGSLRGKMELRCIIVLGDKNPGSFNTLEKTSRPRRGCFRSCRKLKVFDCDHMEWCGAFSGTEVVTWDNEVYGDKIKYEFWEEDGGDSQTSTISLSTTYTSTGNPSQTTNGSVSITVKSNDFKIGNSAVEYCDAAEGDGYTYKAGSLYFKIHLRKP